MGVVAAVGGKTLSGKRSRRRGVEVLARAGLVSVAVSFALVGGLALMAALHRGGAQTDRQGALARVAGTSWGAPVLIIIALGFAGYATWRFVLAITGEEVESREDESLLSRAGHAARGLLYSVLAIGTIRLLFSASGGDSSKKQAASLLSWPAGAFLVGAIGVAFIAIALFNGYRAVGKTYEEKLKMWDIPAKRQRMVTAVARFGLLTRMLMFAIIGWFLIRTALDDNARRALGMDGALQKVADQPYGRVLLGIVALGLLAYAAFRAVEARYRKI